MEQVETKVDCCVRKTKTAGLVGLSPTRAQCQRALTREQPPVGRSLPNSGGATNTRLPSGVPPRLLVHLHWAATHCVVVPSFLFAISIFLFAISIFGLALIMCCERLRRQQQNWPQAWSDRPHHCSDSLPASWWFHIRHHRGVEHARHASRYRVHFCWSCPRICGAVPLMRLGLAGTQDRTHANKPRNEHTTTLWLYSRRSRGPSCDLDASLVKGRGRSGGA